MSHYLRQLAAEDIEAVVGAPDRAFGHDERNWLPRLEWQRNRLWELDPDEKVVMSDGWDVLFQGTREQVEKLFPAEGQILIGGEKNCWPDDEAQIHYPMGPTPWMFCNAGTIAGRAGDLLKALLKGFEMGKKDPKLIENDQRLWTWLFLTSSNIFIDYFCGMFQSTMLNITGDGVDPDKAYKGELAIQVESGRLHNFRTKTIPAFLHCNGGHDWSARELDLMRVPREEAA